MATRRDRSGSLWLVQAFSGLLLVCDIGVAEEAPKKAPEPAKCTHAPGSHIKLAKPEDCKKAARGPYRSYSKEDLESTGETNVADALRKLDPSFR